MARIFLARASMVAIRPGSSNPFQVLLKVGEVPVGFGVEVQEVAEFLLKAVGPERWGMFWWKVQTK